MSDFNTEIFESKCSVKLRHLKPNEHDELIRILSLNKAWLILAALIKNPDDDNEHLYTSEDINIIENQKQPVECFWNDWIYRGRRQATIGDLLKYLNEAQLLRAASFVQAELLKISESNSNREADSETLSAILNTSNSSSEEIAFLNELLNGVILSELTLYHIDFIREITQNFDDTIEGNGGHKIGEGAYGTVYKAKILDALVAVKKLKNFIDKQFFTELNTLTQCKHENLLPLLGYSIGESSCCLIYKYMPNGSLQDRLAGCNNSESLPFETRLSIAYGTASGINFLHTFAEKPMIHRDIKSANILLDEDYMPKIGDFGLVRMGSSSTTVSFAVTENVCGTRVYMPYEAFNGDVSVKWDTYSFGVVLLELLTGLPPYDSDRDGIDLVTHMENYDDIIGKLDRIIEWDIEKALELYRIAKQCLIFQKKNRPTLTKIFPDLEKCCQIPREQPSSEIFI